MRLRYLALVVTLCSVSPGFAVEARGEGVLRLRDPSLPFFASPCAPTLSTTPGSVQGVTYACRPFAVSPVHICVVELSRLRRYVLVCGSSVPLAVSATLGAHVFSLVMASW